jgi:hypothetical protein
VDGPLLVGPQAAAPAAPFRGVDRAQQRNLEATLERVGGKRRQPVVVVDEVKVQRLAQAVSQLLEPVVGLPGAGVEIGRRRFGRVDAMDCQAREVLLRFPARVSRRDHVHLDALPHERRHEFGHVPTQAADHVRRVLPGKEQYTHCHHSGRAGRRWQRWTLMVRAEQAGLCHPERSEGSAPRPATSSCASACSSRYLQAGVGALYYGRGTAANSRPRPDGWQDAYGDSPQGWD